jgi:hypothetical protein
VVFVELLVELLEVELELVESLDDELELELGSLLEVVAGLLALLVTDAVEVLLVEVW